MARKKKPEDTAVLVTPAGGSIIDPEKPAMAPAVVEDDGPVAGFVIDDDLDDTQTAPGQCLTAALNDDPKALYRALLIKAANTLDNTESARDISSLILNTLKLVDRVYADVDLSEADDSDPVAVMSKILAKEYNVSS